MLESIPIEERVPIGADFNGHVGEGSRGDEEVMRRLGVKERNLEAPMVVGFFPLNGCSEHLLPQERRTKRDI